MDLPSGTDLGQGMRIEFRPSSLDAPGPDAQPPDPSEGTHPARRPTSAQASQGHPCVRAPGAGRGPGHPEAARDLTCSEQVCAKVRSWVHVGAALVCGHTEPRASARRWGWGSTAGLGGEGDGTGSGERASLGEQP